MGSLQWPHSLVVCCSLPGTNMTMVCILTWLQSTHSLSCLFMQRVVMYESVASTAPSTHHTHTDTQTLTDIHTTAAARQHTSVISRSHQGVTSYSNTCCLRQTDADEFKNDVIGQFRCDCTPTKYTLDGNAADLKDINVSKFCTLRYNLSFLPQLLGFPTVPYNTEVLRPSFFSSFF